MESTISRNRLTALALCGVAAPVLYVAAATAGGLRYPGYDHFKNAISVLGATGSPSASLMNFAGFLPYGVLVAVFALALHRGIRPDVGGWLGPAVLLLYGVAYVGVAMAPCDPGCQSTTPSLHHRLHLLLGDFIFLTAILAPYTLYSRMRKDPAWQSLAVATLVLPSAAWVILEIPGMGMSGALHQRLWLLLLFLWIELLAVRLLRLGAGRDILSTQSVEYPV
jgi:Protein of unknown function (DUF998)